MTDVTAAIQNTVPISMFNRGLAGKIFEEVKKVGSKVVMKNNTAECVLMSPELYLELKEEINDARLLELAIDRWEKTDPSTWISGEEVFQKLGITEEDLADFENVELE